MNTFSKSFFATLAGVIALGSASFGTKAGEHLSTQVLKPGQGVSLDMGTKKVAAYYLAGDKVCDVTFMIADLPDADGHVTAAITRMNVPVAAGSQSRIFTSEGHAVEASCALSTKIVSLRPLSFTASIAK